MQGRGFNSFASNMIKLSVIETKWSCLLARTHALILYISIWKFDFGPETLPGLSRNGPRGFLILSPNEANRTQIFLPQHDRIQHSPASLQRKVSKTPRLLKGLWHASAHVRQLDFSPADSFSRLAFGEEILFHRPWDARESHNISIQELFGPFGKF